MTNDNNNNDVNDEVDPRWRQTVWDINLNPEKRFFKIDCTVKCSKCQKTIKGQIILDRQTLTIQDTVPFLIINEIECDDCNKDFRKDFADMFDEALKEKKLTSKDLGIDDTWRDK